MVVANQQTSNSKCTKTKCLAMICLGEWTSRSCYQKIPQCKSQFTGSLPIQLKYRSQPKRGSVVASWSLSNRTWDPSVGPWSPVGRSQAELRTQAWVPGHQLVALKPNLGPKRGSLVTSGSLQKQTWAPSVGPKFKDSLNVSLSEDVLVYYQALFGTSLTSWINIGHFVGTQHSNI